MDGHSLESLGITGHDATRADRNGWTVWRKAGPASSKWRPKNGPKTNGEDVAREIYLRNHAELSRAWTSGQRRYGTIVLVCPNGRIAEHFARHRDDPTMVGQPKYAKGQTVSRLLDGVPVVSKITRIRWNARDREHHYVLTGGAVRWWPEGQLSEPQATDQTMQCDHPIASVVSGREGTSFCRECEEAARIAVPTREFKINAHITIGCYTNVMARTETEAREIAVDRLVGTLSSTAFGMETADDAWVSDALDGIPQIKDIETVGDSNGGP